jgi:hypothetical protein
VPKVSELPKAGHRDALDKGAVKMAQFIQCALRQHLHRFVHSRKFLSQDVRKLMQ